MVRLDQLKPNPRAQPPRCPYCGLPARFDDGSTRRRSTPAWICTWYPGCDAYVGCHPRSNIPMGSLANAALRQGRASVHMRMDQYWRYSGGKLTRKDVYQIVATAMQRRSFHAGTAREQDIEAFDAAWPVIERLARRAIAAAR